MIDWDESATLAREAASKRNRAVNLSTAETLRALSDCIGYMARALEEGDEIMGTIAGEGIANHLSALPAHVRHVFMEHLDDEAARGARADRLYMEARP